MPVLPTRASNTLSRCGTESWSSWSPPVVSSSPLGAGSFGGTGAVGSGVVSSVSGTEWSSPVESSPGVVVSVPSSLVEVSSESAPGVLPVEGPAVRGRPEPGRRGLVEARVVREVGSAEGPAASTGPVTPGSSVCAAARRAAASSRRPRALSISVSMSARPCAARSWDSRASSWTRAASSACPRAVSASERALPAVAAAPGSCDRTSRRSASSRSRPLLASSRSALSRASRARTSARSASNLPTWAVT